MIDDLYNDNQSSTTSQTTAFITNNSVGNGGTENISTFMDGLIALLSIVIVIALIIGIIYAILIGIRKYLRSKKIKQTWKNFVFLDIAIPKETMEQTQKETGSKRDDKEMLAVGEQIYAIMSEYAQSGFKNWLYGGERFSLEIVNIDKEIRFWVACSKETADVVSRQIVTVYPKCNIQNLVRLNYLNRVVLVMGRRLTLDFDMNCHLEPIK